MLELNVVEVEINNAAYAGEYGSSSSWSGSCCYSS